MNKVDRESFLRDLAEMQAEVNTLFGDYGLDSPDVDCDIEDCDLPVDDKDILTIFNLYKELYQILDNYR